MPIEKAFAIHASPHEIYAALERDVASAPRGEEAGFDVLRRERDRELELQVTMGGIPCWLTYRLEPKEGYTEVVALLTPFGFRYALFRIMTLGMHDHGFEVALVQGLANLKESVEGAAPAASPPADDAGRDEP
ncbi:MAG: hypothetical protein IVW36_04640 [Dehalococcoidia bacterium]|nr:hypothetical protein [Dehalococcoidia bacterium]